MLVVLLWLLLLLLLLHDGLSQVGLVGHLDLALASRYGAMLPTRLIQPGQVAGQLMILERTPSRTHGLLHKAGVDDIITVLVDDHLLRGVLVHEEQLGHRGHHVAIVDDAVRVRYKGVVQTGECVIACGQRIINKINVRSM